MTSFTKPGESVRFGSTRVHSAGAPLLTLRAVRPVALRRTGTDRHSLGGGSRCHYHWWRGDLLLSTMERTSGGAGRVVAHVRVREQVPMPRSPEEDLITTASRHDRYTVSVCRTEETAVDRLRDAIDGR